jgi:hypothetical protein
MNERKPERKVEANSFGIILRKGEQIVHSWKSTYLCFKTLESMRGYLVLTNQRLVMCEERGYIQRPFLLLLILT